MSGSGGGGTFVGAGEVHDVFVPEVHTYATVHQHVQAVDEAVGVLRTRVEQLELQVNGRVYASDELEAERVARTGGEPRVTMTTMLHHQIEQLRQELAIAQRRATAAEEREDSIKLLAKGLEERVVAKEQQATTLEIEVARQLNVVAAKETRARVAEKKVKEVQRELDKLIRSAEKVLGAIGDADGFDDL